RAEQEVGELQQAGDADRDEPPGGRPGQRLADTGAPQPAGQPQGAEHRAQYQHGQVGGQGGRRERPADQGQPDEDRQYQPHRAERTAPITVSRLPWPVNPAASRCPPPPSATATAATSTPPLLRSDTPHSSGPSCLSTQATSASSATRTASIS